MKRGKTILLIVVLFILCIICGVGYCLTSSKGKLINYEGNQTLETGGLSFRLGIDKIGFLLNTVDKKFKLVRIRLDNHSKETIRLSAENDNIDLYFKKDPNAFVDPMKPLEEHRNDSVKIPGILDLSIHDPNLWSSFTEEIRNNITYPNSIEKGETEVITVFFPAAKIETLPLAIRYKIASTQGEAVEIRLRMVRAR